MPTSLDGELTLSAMAPFSVGLSGTARPALSSTCHSTAWTWTSTPQACLRFKRLVHRQWQHLARAGGRDHDLEAERLLRREARFGQQRLTLRGIEGVLVHRLAEGHGQTCG